ncbi:hypothetical protein H0H92_000429 [Tricholoma furcatifolium]|nr:hypothetical protein H0H92_000429 [Tricholoma furcatifolium]
MSNRGDTPEKNQHHASPLGLGSTAALPDTFQDWYTSQFGTPASAEVMKLARREIMMAVWLCLLEPEFMDAYVNGMLNTDSDSVLRRWFPRFVFHGMHGLS